jgi:hypothetical protein
MGAPVRGHGGTIGFDRVTFLRSRDLQQQARGAGRAGYSERQPLTGVGGALRPKLVELTCIARCQARVL